MHMTDRGLLALARHEGIVPAPYLDVKRVWTFGVGHTAAAGAPDPGRMPRGMPADLDAGIREALPAVPGRPRPLRGRGAARRDRAARAPRVRCAGVLPLQHRRDRAGGADTGAQCRRPGRRGRGVHELAPAGQPAPRREAERDLFLHGRYPEGPIPVWAADADGRVDFSRPVRRLERDRGAGAAAARARRRAREPSRVRCPGRAAGSPRCSLPFPPPSNGADPMRYVLPKSLTWWAGLAAILIGLAALALPEHGPLGELAGVIAKLIGANDAAPATLITLGLGLIGLRDRLERGSAAARSDEGAVGRPAGASRQRRDDARLVLAHRARRRRRLRLHRPRPAARRSAASPTSPKSGFAASEIRSGTDLAVDAQDAEGVLTSDTHHRDRHPRRPLGQCRGRGLAGELERRRRSAC